MSTDPPLTFRVAQQAGSPDKPSEDRVILTPNASIVLDGASQWTPLKRSGGWLAEELGKRLQQGLLRDPLIDLVDLLDQVADDLIRQHELKRGEAPATTVNIVRATQERVDVLVLCDSPVFVRESGGQIHEIRDDPLTTATSHLSRPSKSVPKSDPAWLIYIKDFESLRNKHDGFWCISATPDVAQEAITAEFECKEQLCVLAATDGVSIGIDQYRYPPSLEASFELADRDPMLLIKEVRSAEMNDSDRSR